MVSQSIFSLVGVISTSWQNDISACMVIAENIIMYTMAHVLSLCNSTRSSLWNVGLAYASKTYQNNKAVRLMLCSGGYDGGPQQLPMLWSHIPDIARVSQTSSIPENDVGTYFDIHSS